MTLENLVQEAGGLLFAARVAPRLNALSLPLLARASRRLRDVLVEAELLDLAAPLDGAAACGGSPALLRWALAEGLPKDWRVCRACAAAGATEALDAARGVPGCVVDVGVPAAAAGNGHIDTLRWVLDNGFDADASTTRAAARGGELACLRLAVSKGVPYDGMACRAAAIGGHLACLRFLREALRCPWNGQVLEEAARHGHHDVLVYAHANGCRLDRHAMWAAASGGHLEVLVWLVEVGGFALDARVLNAAAKEGHLHVVTYCVEGGVEPGKETCAFASSRGHLDLLQFCLAHGAKWDRDWCTRIAKPNVRAWLDTLDDGPARDEAPPATLNGAHRFAHAVHRELNSRAEAAGQQRQPGQLEAWLEGWSIDHEGAVFHAITDTPA